MDTVSGLVNFPFKNFDPGEKAVLLR